MATGTRTKAAKNKSDNTPKSAVPKKKRVNCGVCLQPVVDQSDTEDGHDAVFCDGKCQCWLHRSCVGLTKSRFDLVCGSSDKFLCCYCQLDCQSTLLSEVGKSVSLLSDKLNVLIADLQPLRDKLSLLSRSIPPLDDPAPMPPLANISRDVHGDSSSASYERKFNLVLRGLPESPEGTSKSARLSSDLHESTLVLSSIVPGLSDSSIRDCFRLGKFFAGRHRPLLVKFTRSCDVATALSNRSKLSAGDFPGVYIKPDLSHKARRIESILLKERWNLIESGVARASIKLQGSSLFVNNLLFGSVTDAGFQLSSDSVASPDDMVSSVSNEPSEGPRDSHSS